MKTIPSTGVQQSVAHDLTIPDPKPEISKAILNGTNTRTDEDHPDGDRKDSQ